jgi:hypothetical protein
MPIETRIVSPKTARDGKLEVSPELAEHLDQLGSEFPVETPNGPGRARATSMECTCAKGAGSGHVHHFVESPLFTSLEAGARVELEVDAEQRTLRVRR